MGGIILTEERDFGLFTRIRVPESPPLQPQGDLMALACVEGHAGSWRLFIRLLAMETVPQLIPSEGNHWGVFSDYTYEK